MLRQIFTKRRGKVLRQEACLPDGSLRTLVTPYPRDRRVTHDVDGAGPPVSTCARDLERAP